MSVFRFKFALGKLRSLIQRLWHCVLLACDWIFYVVPVVVVIMVAILIVTSGLVVVLVVVYARELIPLVGAGTTIMILIGSLGLFVSSMGVLIAALRYVTERDSGVRKPEERKMEYQDNTTTDTRQKH